MTNNRTEYGIIYNKFVVRVGMMNEQMVGGDCEWTKLKQVRLSLSHVVI